MGAFNDLVYGVVRKIPRGKVVSYGQVARMIGQPKKSRFVGFAMHSNPDPWDIQSQTGIPCHRVVFKDGSLAPGFAFGGPEEQQARLVTEGVRFTADGRVDMGTCRWNGVSTEESLEALSGDGSVPTTPPADFDWAAELGEE